MKFGFKKILALLLAASMVLALFACSREDSKEGDGAVQISPEDIKHSKPQFSSPGGFYIGKTTVRIAYPRSLKEAGVKIRMTFDGSEPNAQSQIYGGGEISLPKKSVMTKFTGLGGNLNVTVIRAAYFDKRGVLCGHIATAVFFQTEKNDRFNLPVVVLTTDPANLTGPEGIFTNSWGKGAEWERPCNIQYYNEAGELVISQDGGMRLFGGSSRGLSQRSLKLYARNSDYFNTTRYDGKGKFRYALFGEERRKADGSVLDVFDSFILRNGGNDSLLTPTQPERAAFIRDGVANLVAAKAAPELLNMNMKPVVVFLNGEYYGLLNMREHENDNAIRNIYDIPKENKENITVISSELDTARGDRYDGTWFYYVLDDGAEGELEEYTDFMNKTAAGELSFDEVAARLDVDGFIKYCAVNLFLCNTDWPHNNLKVWRYTGTPTDKLDGKWHFVFKDMDLGLGRYTCGTEEGFPIELYTKADSRNTRLMLCEYLTFPEGGYPDITENRYPDTLKVAGVLAFLLNNEGFRKDFREYCEKLATEIWPADDLVKLITDTAGSIDYEMQFYVQKKYFGSFRFDMTSDYRLWHESIFGENDSLITWAKERTGSDGYFLNSVNELLGMF